MSTPGLDVLYSAARATLRHSQRPFDGGPAEVSPCLSSAFRTSRDYSSQRSGAAERFAGACAWPGRSPGRCLSGVSGGRSGLEASLLGSALCLQTLEVAGLVVHVAHGRSDGTVTCDLGQRGVHGLGDSSVGGVALRS